VRAAGQQVTADNETYDGTVPGGGATTWGMVVEGPDQPLGNLTCTPR
jgi:hypothetical protein